MSKTLAAPAPPPAPPRAFAPPAVEVGQVVLWSFGPGSGEVPGVAVVTKVGSTSINCCVHHESTRDHINKTGVRHKDDPFLKDMPLHSAGCWDLTPRDKRVDALLAAFPPEGAAFDEEG